MPTHPDLRSALEFESISLGQLFEQASARGRGTPQEVADHRELAFHSVMRRLFPLPKVVTKGQILAHGGSKSASIDCLVLNEHHPRIRDENGKYSIILADGVDFAIDLKGTLDTSELARLLKQAASVGKTKRAQSPAFKPGTFSSSTQESYDAGFHVPFAAYIQKAEMSIGRIAAEIVRWNEAQSVPPPERAIAYVIHARGILLDTSRHTVIRNALWTRSPPGLVWIPLGINTFAGLLVIVATEPQAILEISSSIMSRYLSNDLFREVEPERMAFYKEAGEQTVHQLELSVPGVAHMIESLVQRFDEHQEPPPPA